MHEKLARLLNVGWSKAQQESARLFPGDRRQIARRAFDETGLRPGDDPRLLAVALGFRVVRATWLRGCGGEVTDGVRIVYQPSGKVPEERIRAAHGLAHALLRREGWDHSETDAILLTRDFINQP